MVLRCARHTAAIYDRGGRHRLGDLDPITAVSWQRVRDDISFGSVTIQNPTLECLSLLNDRLEPERSELVLFRDGDRVWEGPVTLMTDGRDAVKIEARDVLHYAYRLIMRSEYNNNYPNVTTVTERAKTILETELARRETESPPINVLPYLRVFQRGDDARTSRATKPYSRTVYQDIDEMAWRAGLDYTVVGRSIILWDTHVEFARTPQVSEQDFLGEIIVSRYGMNHATYAAVTDGQGNWGESGGVDPYYGLWEVLDTAYDEESANGAAPPSVAEMTSQAERNMNGKNPVPTIVRVPDGTRLNPNGVLTIDHLVPGTHVPLVATLTVRKYSQMQKLDRVQVTETATDGESINVTFSPASAEDQPPEEG